jgi:hypothetical protein
LSFICPKIIGPGNTKGGSITVPLTSCLTGLNWSVLKIKTKIVSCHTADSKLVKEEVDGTVILPPLVFPDRTIPDLRLIHTSDETDRFVQSHQLKLLEENC